MIDISIVYLKDKDISTLMITSMRAWWMTHAKQGVLHRVDVLDPD